MPHREDHEAVDRVIAKQLQMHPEAHRAYLDDATFHHAVEVIRQVLIFVRESARASGIHPDAADDMIRNTVRETIIALPAYAKETNRG